MSETCREILNNSGWEFNKRPSVCSSGEEDEFKLSADMNFEGSWAWPAQRPQLHATKNKTSMS